MSFAISVWRVAGGVIVEADRRIKSCSPNLGGTGWTVGLGRGGNIAASYATGPGMGSISTRNALNSGVSALASPTKGVSELGPKPFLVLPVKPQCSGMPTTCTVLPSQVSGWIRLVTTTLALIEPRFDQTRTQLPVLMLFSCASASPISTKNSGWSDALICPCLVQ